MLSHPLLVDAAERLFVPVAVYNNVGGKDREVLEAFGEPTWNNPVVRVLGPDGKALAPRLAGDYSVAGLARTLVKALEARGTAPPFWLAQLAPPPLERATFGMHCFWQGEVKLGQLDGVYDTRTGWLGGTEVVELRFDPRTISYAKLLAQAQKLSCATRVFTHSAQQLELARAAVGERALAHPGTLRATPQDDSHALKRSPLRFVPTTPAQATKLNAAVASGQDPRPFLAPRQRELLDAIQAHPKAGWAVAIGVDDLRAAMQAAEALAHAKR